MQTRTGVSSRVRNDVRQTAARCLLTRTSAATGVCAATTSESSSALSPLYELFVRVLSGGSILEQRWREDQLVIHPRLGPSHIVSYLSRKSLVV
jgi:hypothetical protein